jgi:hypothetical protein
MGPRIGDALRTLAAPGLWLLALGDWPLSKDGLAAEPEAGENDRERVGGLAGDYAG